MKNIHLLKTYKPTGIFQSNSGLQFSIRDKVRVYPLIGFHIYITSDEEIKEGDYAIQFHYGKISIVNCDSQNKSVINNKSLDLYATKIILTTDQDLIADGVQAIDDEFLEWFVKNTSCEMVEIDRDEKEVGNHLGGVVTEYGDYKIIIPQEEPKQETLTYTEAAKKEERIFNSTMMSKQETLEEAAANLADPNLCKTDNWIAGANYQAERMYSEEDLLSAFEAGMMFIGEDKGSFGEWFEQFKKKD